MSILKYISLHTLHIILDKCIYKYLCLCVYHILIVNNLQKAVGNVKFDLSHSVSDRKRQVSKGGNLLDA